MASYEGVGAVGRTLQALLQDRIDHPNGGATPVPVTLGAPGPERDPEGAAEDVRVNLFLYQVTENAFLANQEIPGTGHAGTYGSPPLSLSLHFLLTVYGSTANGDFFDETPSHLLLGSAMRVLHDNAIVTESVMSRREPSGVPLLDPRLRDEHENVKLTLWPLGLEDLSNIWTALALPYRLSVAYEVSVVQIESGRPRRYPRPVQEPPEAGPRVHVTTLRRPRLASITVRRDGDPPDFERSTPFARVGDTLVLRGSDLAGEGLAVRIGRVELAPETASAAGDHVEVTVPDDALADGSAIPPTDRLQPGTHGVGVAAMSPTLPGAAVGSGQAAFTLVPTVAAVTASGRVLTVEGKRLMADDLPGQVVVGDAVTEREDYRPGSDSESVEVDLPDTLPAWPASALVSGDLSDFPDLPSNFDLSVTVGGDGPHTATLTSLPTSLPEAAQLLEAAIRGAETSQAFTGARVAATDGRLVVLPGGLTAAVEFDTGSLANKLKLSPGAGGEDREVYLSGALRPFLGVSAASPEVEVTIGGSAQEVTLASSPTSAAAAAALLEEAIGDAPGAAFAETRVTTLGDQLCVVPPAGEGVAFAPTGNDERTVAELRLAATYSVRARVGAVEGIDERSVELPS